MCHKMPKYTVVRIYRAIYLCKSPYLIRSWKLYRDGLARNWNTTKTNQAKLNGKFYILPTYLFFPLLSDSFVEFRKSFEIYSHHRKNSSNTRDLHFLVIKRPADFFLRILLVNKYVFSHLFEFIKYIFWFDKFFLGFNKIRENYLCTLSK